MRSIPSITHSAALVVDPRLIVTRRRLAFVAVLMFMGLLMAWIIPAISVPSSAPPVLQAAIKVLAPPAQPAEAAGSCGGYSYVDQWYLKDSKSNYTGTEFINVYRKDKTHFAVMTNSEAGKKHFFEARIYSISPNGTSYLVDKSERYSTQTRCAKITVSEGATIKFKGVQRKNSKDDKVQYTRTAIWKTH